MTTIGRPPTCTCGGCSRCQNAARNRRWWASLSAEERHERVARRRVDRGRINERYRATHPTPVRLSPDERRDRRDAAAKRTTEKYPTKRAARIALGNAVRDGRVIKSPCVDCGEVRSEGHHDDYARPLVVTWLCSLHHKARHPRLATQAHAEGARA